MYCALCLKIYNDIVPDVIRSSVIYLIFIILSSLILSFFHSNCDYAITDQSIDTSNGVTAALFYRENMVASSGAADG